MSIVVSRRKTVKGTVWLVLLAALCLVWFAVGCSDSTDPGSGDDTVTVTFVPAARNHEINLAETLDFSISAPEANTVIVSWLRGGLPSGSEESYTYEPSALGVDTLRVVVDADGVGRSYFWVVNVVSIPSTAPPVPLAVMAGPGPGPGDVSVTWTKVGASTFPMDEYVVAVSYDGEITEENWDQARELRRVTHRVSQVGYEETFTVAEDGMIADAQAWFVVRAVDTLGQISGIGQNGFTTITTGWWLNGVVRGEEGEALVGVIVASDEPAISVNTDLNGVFRLGPFRSIDQIEVGTTSSTRPGEGWYDFRSSPLDSVGGKDFEIVLIKRHFLDENCDLYGGQFLTYLRTMSRTMDDMADPDNALMKKWASYPLKVYLPPFVTGENVDLAGAGRFAINFWNTAMGELYFEETMEPEAAQIVFFFGDIGPELFGKTSLLEPAGTDIVFGDVVPEKVQVFLGDVLAPTVFAQEVALHELGHALGMLAHSGCFESGHLMVPGAVGALSNDFPIHPDELRAAAAIRYLPQYVDMSKYSLGQ